MGKNKNRDYTKFSTDNYKPEEPAVEVVENETAEIEVCGEPVVSKVGKVVDCVKLNVRKLPNRNAEIVCELKKGDHVEVYENDSTVEFYKVCTYVGIEGYCVKHYIKLK